MVITTSIYNIQSISISLGFVSLKLICMYEGVIARSILVINPCNQCLVLLVDAVDLREIKHVLDSKRQTLTNITIYIQVASLRSKLIRCVALVRNRIH